MGIVVERTVDSSRECERVLIAASEGGASSVWLTPSYSQVLERRKALALKKSPLRCGAAVSTLSAWAEDMWELYGDGRALVSIDQRKILMQRVLKNERDAFGVPLFAATSGTVDLLCRMVQQGFGLDAFVRAVERFDDPSSFDAHLTETHRRMLLAARLYAQLLSEHGFCERAEAMRLLAAKEDIVWPVVVCENLHTLQPQDAAFFARLSGRTKVTFVLGIAQRSQFDATQALIAALSSFGATCEIVGPEGGSCVQEADVCLRSKESARHPELSQLIACLYASEAGMVVQPQGALRALLPAGRYAQASLLAQAIRAEVGEVLVVCNDPRAAFDELAQRLAGSGCSIEASYTVPFASTDFGGAFLDAYEAFTDDKIDARQVTDYMLSNVTEEGVRTAYALDTTWRANRLVDAETVQSSLDERTSEITASFAKFILCGEIDEALSLAEKRYIAQAHVDEAFKVEQLSAIRAMRRLLEQVDRLGESLECAYELLDSLRVRVSVLVEGSNALPKKPCAHVKIAFYRDAAQLPSCSFDAVFMCDMNAQDQPVRLRRSSVDGLLEALGYSYERNALFESRLRMLQVVDTAKNKLYMVRALHDENAAELYPSVAYEEISACYAGAGVNVDKATALPEPLLSYCVQNGEELLTENLFRVPPKGHEILNTGSADAVSPRLLEKLLGPVKALSASAIENYLDCPHKWFAMRRLRLGHVDAGFTALEKGSFLHEVLSCFYAAHKAEFGKEKPADDPFEIERARAVLDRVFFEVCDRQKGRKFHENPLIATTQSEQRQLDELRRHLGGFVARDAKLLPGFKPQHFEYRFGYGEPFVYAGVALRGSIDRIDVDDKGRAVVVDYKSSLSSSYHLIQSADDEVNEFVLPPKIQTLIYAQVVRKALDLQPVGALYVHTLRPGSQPQACGAFDDALFGSEDLLGINVKRNALSQSGFRTFEDLLDGVEGMIAERLKGLTAGDISIAPHFEGVCGFCPVLACEGRM